MPEQIPAPSRLRPELDRAVIEHAYRGVRLQLMVRILLVAFVALTVIILPPVRGALACYAVVVGYAVWAACFGWWVWRRGPDSVRWAWLALFVDLAVLAGMTLLTGVAAEQSWTSDVLVNGLFLIPVLAATQLRPGVCAIVVAPTILAYLAASAATQAANDEPWASILLRTLVLVGVGAGCIGLSRIQRSRVKAISGLLGERTELLAEMMRLEDRERRALSEQLHDGALQYVLAARQDLDDLRELVGEQACERIDHALGESSRLLRSTVTDLHPAVLEHAGLARAVRELARSAGDRGGFAVEVDVDAWPDTVRTPLDPLLLSTARELLTNVVKHAAASEVRVTLGLRDGLARLVVADNGSGLADGVLETSLRQGHIGLHSHRLRVEAAGGYLTFTPAQPSGTVVTVELICPVVPGVTSSDEVTIGVSGG